MDIQLDPQPANSPDLNVLDLGFFNSIQSLQHEAAPRNVDDLVQAVVKTFNDVSCEKLDGVILSLQKVMESVMLYKGSNSFASSHVEKAKLRRRGRLPIALKCREEEIESCEDVSKFNREK